MKKELRYIKNTYTDFTAGIGKFDEAKFKEKLWKEHEKGKYIL